MPAVFTRKTIACNIEAIPIERLLLIAAVGFFKIHFVMIKENAHVICNWIYHYRCGGRFYRHCDTEGHDKKLTSDNH
jgi:hypothetical protein